MAVTRAVRVVSSKVSQKIRIFLLEGLLRPLRPPNMVRLGTYYGGWWIPEIDPSAGAAVCVGAGTDISFDLELARLGYDVVTVDPTPSALAYLEGFRDRLTVVPVGVWTHSGEVSFGQDAEWSESWMISDAAPGGTELGRQDVMPVRTVADLLREVGVEEVSILKLDIEGAEHVVLEQMLTTSVRPAVLGIEFDDHRVRAVVRSVRRLRRAGYELWHIENLNYLFVRR